MKTNKKPREQRRCVEVDCVPKIALRIYSPFLTPESLWKCAFSFEPIDADSVRCGMGADFIEAFLDALAVARMVFESMTPKDWTDSDDLLDCTDFPIKNDRAFYINRKTGR